MYAVRIKFVALVIFGMMCLVLLRLGYMQVLRAEYYREEGRRRQVTNYWQSAARGTILARDGTVLAEDSPITSVCVVLADLEKFEDKTGRPRQEWYARVAGIVGRSPEEVGAAVRKVLDDIDDEVEKDTARTLASGRDTPKRLAAQARRDARIIRNRAQGQKRPIFQDVDWETAVRAEFDSPDLPGLAVIQTMRRRYSEIAPHVIGYLGMVTQDEYDLYRFDYLGDERKRVLSRSELTGRRGVERQYNAELRGHIGHKKAVINAHRQLQLILEDEAAEQGETISLTIDPVIQKAAEGALERIFEGEGRCGVAVCIDVHTGEILTLASVPGFDPETFSRDYGELVDPEGLGRYHPLLNRAISAGYPLGSVFKIITATAALETGRISRSTTFDCSGSFRLGRAEFRCMHVHYTLDLIDAIKRSCNVYFYNAGVRAGGEALSVWARKYGLGSSAYIDLPGESPGNVEMPTVPGQTANLSIGQGSLLVTPLQAARMIAAVANGGWLVTPHLRLDAPAADPAHVGLSRGTLDIIREGLYEVVNEPGGTGYRTVKSDLITIAGKTGTAQAPPDGEIRGDHAWFVGFAPFDEPEIAFAVIIERGGHGGAAAGPVAKAIAEAYATRETVR